MNILNVGGSSGLSVSKRKLRKMNELLPLMSQYNTSVNREVLRGTRIRVTKLF